MSALGCAGFGGMPPRALASNRPRSQAAACCAACGWMAPSHGYREGAQTEGGRSELAFLDAMELFGIAIAAGSPIEPMLPRGRGKHGRPLAREFARRQEVNLLAGRCEGRRLSTWGSGAEPDVKRIHRPADAGGQPGSSLDGGSSCRAALSCARRRKQEAMERIRKMPTKLDIVLSLCFLPPTVRARHWFRRNWINLLNFLNDLMG